NSGSALKPKIAAALLATALFSAYLPACQTKPIAADAQAPTTPPKRLSQRMPLAQYIPAPGLRWLVQLKPRALVENESIRNDWQPVFSSQRMAAFRAASGFDPS